jgi:hypothetical protein
MLVNTSNLCHCFYYWLSRFKIQQSLNIVKKFKKKSIRRGAFILTLLPHFLQTHASTIFYFISFTVTLLFSFLSTIIAKFGIVVKDCFSPTTDL